MNAPAPAPSLKLPPLDAAQNYLVAVGITPSIFQGYPAGSRGIVTGYLRAVRLGDLGSMPYSRWLDARTAELAERLARSDDPQAMWGIARKCINIFITLALMNGQLQAEYGLSRFQDNAEVPLDSRVMDRLRETDPTLPRLPIKALEPEVNKRFQDVAAAVAAQAHVGRGCLDACLWT